MTVGAVTRPFWTSASWGATLVQTPPAAVTNLRVTKDHYYSRLARLEWDWIERGESISLSRDGTIIATLPAGTTSYIDSQLVLDTNYTYVLTAINSAGSSSASLSYTFQTRLPRVTYTKTYQQTATTTTYEPVMPPMSEVDAYDVIYIVVEKMGTGFTTSNNSAWAEWGQSPHGNGTLEAYYHRVQPTSDPFGAAVPPRFVMTAGTTTEWAVTVMVIKDVDVYVNHPFLKEPNIVAPIINWSSQPANAAPAMPRWEAYSGSGLVLTAFGTSASTATSNYSLSISSPTNSILPNKVSTPTSLGRVFNTVMWDDVKNIGGGTDQNFSANVAGGHTLMHTWWPEAAVTKVPFQWSAGMVTSTTATSYAFPFGTGTPATGDYILGIMVLPSGTGAVGATLTNANTGFTSPRLVVDTRNQHPTVRIAIWSTYGTAATNAAALSFTFTFPSGSVPTIHGAYVKGVGDPSPVVSVLANANDIVLPVPSKALLLGFLGTRAEDMNVAGHYIKPNDGWSTTDSHYVEIGAPSASRNYNSTSPNFASLGFIGEAHRAGDVLFSTPLPAGFSTVPVKVLVALPSQSARFGNSLTDAIPQEMVASFAAFGIPL